MMGLLAGESNSARCSAGAMVDLLSALTKPLERLVATAQNGYEVARFGGLETGAVPSPFQATSCACDPMLVTLAI